MRLSKIQKVFIEAQLKDGVNVNQIAKDLKIDVENVITYAAKIPKEAQPSVVPTKKTESGLLEMTRGRSTSGEPLKGVTLMNGAASGRTDKEPGLKKNSSPGRNDHIAKCR